jgi:hypothetical protein
MALKRQFEMWLLRMVPHALRDDFMTVGVVVVEAVSGHTPSAISHPLSAASCLPPAASRPEEGVVGGEGQAPARFAEVRLTRDWKRVECFAPEIEVEILERLEFEVRGRLKEIRNRGDLLRMLEERFGPTFDVGPAKALVAEDPTAEMRTLEAMYLAPVRAEAPGRHERRMGRMGIVSRMQDAFAEAGVLEWLQRDLDMREFTGENDPFRVDFGFRVGKSLKMFQGLAVNLSRDPAVTLAYRYARIQAGMRSREEEALLTAIVSEEALQARGEAASGIAMLRASAVEVRGVGEMGEIAARLRGEMQA